MPDSNVENIDGTMNELDIHSRLSAQILEIRQAFIKRSIEYPNIVTRFYSLASDWILETVRNDNSSGSQVNKVNKAEGFLESCFRLSGYSDIEAMPHIKSVYRLALLKSVKPEPK